MLAPERPTDGTETAVETGRGLNIPAAYFTAYSDKETIHLSVQARRLRDSEARYSATLASIEDGVIATDEHGQVTYMNALAEELTEWKLSDAHGLAIEEVLQLVDEDSKATVENPVRSVLASRAAAPRANAGLLIGRKGLSVPVKDNAAAMITKDGDVIGAVCAFRDLRARRVTEDALFKAEEQLRHSQKLDAVGRLAGGVAHDFNNLLTIINGCADLALDNKDLNAATRDLLRDIGCAGQRAAALTSHLLAFSRKQVMAPVILNLNTVLKNLESMVRRIVREDIALTFTLCPSLGYVKADQSQFEQVIMNLVVNAREAMKPGGHLIIETFNLELESGKVSEEAEIKPGRYVVMSVGDNGLGMSEAVKAQIFEPFFTTKGSRNGTGLGLATVHGIVSQSGGGIHIESQPGQGTTFFIYLPLIEQSAPMERATGKTVSVPQMGSETILLVEDEDAVRSVLSSILRRFGYKVLPARSGKEAVDICESLREPVHLLLTDVVMPGMGGLELGQRVRALRPGIPILYLSGYMEDALLRHGMEENGDSFLQKPVTPNALALKVWHTLHREGEKL